MNAVSTLMEWKTQGRAEGFAEGMAAGMLEARRSDLLKVLRLQQSFRTHHLDLFADQSQYIHAFRAATGYTPTRYRARFDVRFSQDTERPTG